ncbi:HTH-type transcriptional regulatory protein GabR [bioreactor metagenome]|uniref:HTH-type transcriptional regulatory protein GabR n=1 Tax=bioreactor metagenome TaxID=1076179 RepID=A0A645G090_9ZZZZ
MSRIEQQTLARFLTDGHFTRCVNRARGHYRARRDTLLAALQSELGRVPVHGAHTGLHLVASPPLALTEKQLTARAQAAGVALRGISHYGTVPRWLPGPSVVLGYGTLDEAGILEGVQRLATAWRHG